MADDMKPKASDRAAGAIMIRIYPEDLPVFERIKQHTGIRSGTEIIRAALRAHARELGIAATLTSQAERSEG